MTRVARELVSASRDVAVGVEILLHDPEASLAAAAMAGARRALDAAKAAGEPIGGRPLLVAELTAAQLRTVLASGEVIAVQPDEAVPPS